MANSQKARVAIVGRPNVGKSALFNRLAGRRISIVHDEPGITRDRIAADCKTGEITFEITDTGGIGAALDDAFADQIRTEADIAMESSDLILFVVDGREDLTPIDSELAQILHRSKAPVILIVNKIDDPKVDNDAAVFSALGFDSPISVSAAHGRNFDLLVKAIDDQLGTLGFTPIKTDPEAKAEQEPIKVAIVGRPNVGKSSLINAILKDERTIVSDIAGTTRDSVDVPYTRGDDPYLLIDTAGMRRRTRRDSSVEVFSAMRAERSIRRADICLLTIDCAKGVVAQDRRIARMIMEAEKPCIIVLNKFDLYHPDAKFRDRLEILEEEMREDLFFLNYAPLLAVSALKNEFLNQIFKSIRRIKKTANDPIGTGTLNRLLRQAIDSAPPPRKRGKRLKLLYCTQKRSDNPSLIPSQEYLLFVNYANILTHTYERYLEKQIRKEQPMIGLPLIFKMKSRTVKLRKK
ncbi:MAG: ribosome biogenesis GTPase Der [Verrucomicrobia bacterium]|nr:ribosome biogenesis GTPase Der [Verrucomicrobiota bacterium]